MRVTPLLLLIALAPVSVPAWAVRVGDVQITGVGEAMSENVRVSLSLTDAVGREVSERRLDYLLRAAEDEAREALEPFGHYTPHVTVTPTRQGEDVTVRIDIAPGPPVRVRAATVAIEGEGGRDRYLREELDAFRPHIGEVLDHGTYEASKVRITRRLAERGYFDADFLARRVEVTRAEQAADIDLRWTSGARYDMGATVFAQTPRPVVREALLQQLVYWEEGSYYHQGKLDRLRESLARLDYFGRIDIEPHPERAVDHRVPVTVTLTPARRDVYTVGLSYGTDSGAGVRLGLERRYVNDRGHKALAQLDWAQRRKTATLQYRIPALAWLDGWYTLSLQGADEQTDYIDTRRLELVASRSGQITRRWTATASVHALRERWQLQPQSPDAAPEEHRYASFTFPSLRGEYVKADDRMFARDGFALVGTLRGGLEGIGSDADFAQAHLSARWYRGVGERSRLIARGELGRTFTDTLVDMPPSLRYYAGGDLSIRGYGWREVGPRYGDYALGARNVVTASLQYEHYLDNGWGGAVFVDSGDAFDDRPNWRTGIGVGVRWRSPVGLVRVDIARGLDDADSPFTLHLNIGPDL
ncbi:MAG TPA: autotransporter assembly complex family protein [Lysobacter sp.]|nr:autotransporter assembly complex family protein [Lysobacter sp.]